LWARSIPRYKITTSKERLAQSQPQNRAITRSGRNRFYSTVTASKEKWQDSEEGSRNRGGHAETLPYFWEGSKGGRRRRLCLPQASNGISLRTLSC